MAGNNNLNTGVVPLPVSQGGTGADTMTTAYSVLLAGTSATNPIQSTASAGSVGHFLVSAGSAAKPVFSMPAGMVQYVKVPMSAADWNGMYDTPKLLLAAGGANTIHFVSNVCIELIYNSAVFILGGAVQVQYDSTANGLGTAASSSAAASAFLVTTTNRLAYLTTAALLGSGTTGAVNKGLYLSNATAAFTTGDSTFNIHVWYSTMVTTV